MSFMTRAQPTITTAVSAAVAILLLSGCSGSSGHVSFRNDGSTDVKVSSGNERFSVAAGDIAELQDDCTESDVEISFVKGSSVTVPGPVCTDQAVVIHEDTAELVKS
jgi:hypothetical protein